MTSQEIRQTFLDFFKEKAHQIVPSAPLVVKDDPTLMFTNAGMNPFKDLFLGNKPITVPRIANTQKCLRVSGKHNDLEEVGHDTYHHTMFEMLGNWSFGDYFKKEAIEWAWELLTQRYKLPTDRLYATVFGGDAADNLPQDTEAATLWAQFLPKERILQASKKDNFWEMGDTGPCGPCTEIHVDLRSEAERKAVEGATLVNQDHPQVIEIWNLVFMQFNRMADGSLVKLPKQHVDTGMGFERLTAALQGKKSNYDTDIFQPTIQHLGKKANLSYGQDTKADIALRVIADHIRAVAFAIADGEMPSNNKAGYVIRRILRRAVRYGYTFLGFREPFMYELVGLLAMQFADVFPELKSQQAFVEKVIQSEEEAFLRTLENGLRRLGQIFEQNQNATAKKIEGELVFELYDTFGFPADLTALIARENGFDIDEKGFEKAMQTQKERSRAAASSDKSDWQELQVSEGVQVEFLGYERLESQAKILKYRQIKEKNKTFYQIVLDQTPFYAESGGQVGDTGLLVSVEDASDTIEIFDTQKENDLIIHLSTKLPKNPSATFRATVNAQKRHHTANNHSATHLLHAALREVLGEHVQQKGSLVNENLLRFDFSHFAKMSEEEILKVESLVNQRIRKNILLQEMRNVPLEDAKKMGAMALFGEKYGEFVRVIVFDKDYSVELCGGTHVAATGQIGFFKIVREESVAAGVRRIEAITAEKAEQFVQEQNLLLNTLKETLKNPKDLTKTVQDLIEDKKRLEKEIERLQAKEIAQVREALLTKVKLHQGDINLIAEKVEVPHAEALKTLAFGIRQQIDRLFMVLTAEIEARPHIAIAISDKLVEDKGLDASKIIKDLAKHIQGGGGGQKFFATAAGKNAAGLKEVLEKAKDLV
ncbi:alanine--tRNA ligase [Hugenholtzia roseola]|uniref:alanine--tRNA ligase n=1 Tax=Hugenholtzia roseola TaxID=1002 RepID=UPI00047D6E9A|nr:alanine--tRNA ligase [Hugenholtzia roseola]